MKKISVLLIDDHALFRIGLEGLFEKRGIEVVAAVATGAEGIEKASTLNPEIILLDVRMPGLNGTQVLRRIRDAGIETPIVMLTTSTEERDLIESLRNGAQGYLLKDIEPDDLVKSLADVLNGKTVVAPALTQVLAKVVQHGNNPTLNRPTPFSELTPREYQILCHLAEGQSNKVIAKNLGISDGTVKLHVKAILRKLGVHSRVEAAVIAVEQELCNKT